MTEQRVGVEVELGVQRHQVALGVAVQGVDFHQRRVGVHVALVDLGEDVYGLVDGLAFQTNGSRHLARLRFGDAGQWVDHLGDDLLGGGVGHFFNVHAAFARSDQGHLLGGAVGHQRHIQLVLDVGAVFDVQAAYLLAFSASLVGDQLHAENLLGQGFYVVDGLGHLHAAALAAATSMDLRLHHPNWAAKLLCCLYSFLDGECRNATGYWHTELTQDFLALVFMNLHESCLSETEGEMPVFLLPKHAEPGSYDMAIEECTMLQCNQKVLCPVGYTYVYT